jgi:hypothetical protein
MELVSAIGLNPAIAPRIWQRLAAVNPAQGSALSRFRDSHPTSESRALKLGALALSLRDRSNGSVEQLVGLADLQARLIGWNRAKNQQSLLASLLRTSLEFGVSSVEYPASWRKSNTENGFQAMAGPKEHIKGSFIHEGVACATFTAQESAELDKLHVEQLIAFAEGNKSQSPQRRNPQDELFWLAGQQAMITSLALRSPRGGTAMVYLLTSRRGVLGATCTFTTHETRDKNFQGILRRMLETWRWD